MDERKSKKILEKLKEILQSELGDDYTGKVKIEFNLQTGGISGKITITKDLKI